MKTPMVRNGAVAQCVSCKAQFKVSPAVVVELVKEGHPPSQTTTPSPSSRSPGPSHEPDLGGIPSELIDQRPATPTGAHAASVRRSKMRKAKTLAGLLLIAMVLVGVIVSVVVFGRKHRQKVEQQAAQNIAAFAEQKAGKSKSKTAVGLAADIDAPDEFFQDAIRVEPVRMGQTTWRPIDQPYLAPQQTGPIKLKDDQWGYHSGDEYAYWGQLVTDSFDLLTSATVTFHLIDYEDNEIARCELSIALVSGQRSVPFFLIVPERWYRRLSRVEIDSQTGSVMPVTVTFDEAQIIIVGTGLKTMARLTAINTSDQSLTQVVFIVKCRDASDRTIGMWRVDWNSTVEPGDSLDLVGSMPVYSPPDATWQIEVLGVGSRDALLDDSMRD